ncbi:MULTISPECIES: hypothetical protein [Flavobacterium]|uniref:DUF4142 domain-containing protein n=1 Tax=Flavobacterium sedimenticola TaxID=3043286 RepID=A0ABT6XMA9_9FLAO|nr:hypothetical protein [Flavobacterium sedimenticola]MDI9256223.1 hypothetical protein [Flavobacterium sedimenticola]
MKTLFPVLLLVALSWVSCQEDPKQRLLEQQKEAQKQEAVFKTISNGWNFNAKPMNLTSSSLTGSWAEWRMFLNELGQKPKSSLGAFKIKAKALSKRGEELNNSVPAEFNLPEIKSRIAAVNTKINAINLYINLQQVPDKEIVKLIQEINTEVASLQFQLEEITRKRQIKMEEGESDMLRMLDTTRAIPTTPVVQPRQ